MRAEDFDVRLLIVLGLFLSTFAAEAAGFEPFPASFQAQQIPTNATIIRDFLEKQ
jgi:hypothetical protein